MILKIETELDYDGQLLIRDYEEVEKIPSKFGLVEDDCPHLQNDLADFLIDLSSAYSDTMEDNCSIYYVTLTDEEYEDFDNVFKNGENIFLTFD